MHRCQNFDFSIAGICVLVNMFVSALLASVVVKPRVSHLLACIMVKMSVSHCLECVAVKMLVSHLLATCCQLKVQPQKTVAGFLKADSWREKHADSGNHRVHLKCTRDFDNFDQKNVKNVFFLSIFKIP
jgi:hypothetical protein